MRLLLAVRVAWARKLAEMGDGTGPGTRPEDVPLPERPSFPEPDGDRPGPLPRPER